MVDGTSANFPSVLGKLNGQRNMPCVLPPMKHACGTVDWEIGTHMTTAILMKGTFAYILLYPQDSIGEEGSEKKKKHTKEKKGSSKRLMFKGPRVERDHQILPTLLFMITQPKRIRLTHFETETSHASLSVHVLAHPNLGPYFHPLV